MSDELRELVAKDDVLDILDALTPEDAEVTHPAHVAYQRVAALAEKRPADDPEPGLRMAVNLCQQQWNHTANAGALEMALMLQKHLRDKTYWPAERPQLSAEQVRPRLLENADVLEILQKYSPLQTKVMGLQTLSQIVGALNALLTGVAEKETK